MRNSSNFLYNFFVILIIDKCKKNWILNTKTKFYFDEHKFKKFQFF